MKAATMLAAYIALEHQRSTPHLTLAITVGNDEMELGRAALDEGLCDGLIAILLDEEGAPAMFFTVAREGMVSHDDLGVLIERAAARCGIETRDHGPWRPGPAS